MHTIYTLGRWISPVVVLLAVALVAAIRGYAQNISFEKRSYEVTKHFCEEGLCGSYVPYDWYNVKYVDVNTEIPELESPILTDKIEIAIIYMRKGYDIITPIAALSPDSLQIINPISIYQFHFPQSWPTPLDDYFEFKASFPRVFFKADWQKIPIIAPADERRALRLKELRADIAQYNQLRDNPKFVRTKEMLKKYGANFSPLHPTTWKQHPPRPRS
ncbi:MAG: hypothetical protein HUK20_01530 [Fibrobacter sp.]|nr:hypothetical protein [Fibrobacter sp.]